MRRPFPLIAATLLALALAPSATSAAPARSWAQRQITAVVQAGLMAPSVAEFRPADAITQSELDALIGGLTQQPVPAGYKDRPVTIASLDLQLVDALGLAPAAQEFNQGARAAGLAVPERFGSEAVARLLGLRRNHPAKQDSLELLPGDPATRAEAAFSAAKILSFTGDETQWASNAAVTFTLPALS